MAAKRAAAAAKAQEQVNTGATPDPDTQKSNSAPPSTFDEYLKTRSDQPQE